MTFDDSRVKSLLKVRNHFKNYSWDISSGSPLKNAKAVKYYPIH